MKIGMVLLPFTIAALPITHEALSQTFSIRGSVSAYQGPVRFASVTFVDQTDSSKKFTAVTDETGNYRLSIVTNVSSKPSNVPQSIKLEQNYPNPFSSSTAISYRLKKTAQAKLTIFDILGREVRVFSTNSQDVGVHGVMWDGRNNLGEKVAAGVYFYRLQAGDETLVRKMVLESDNATISMPSTKESSSWTKEPKKQVVAEMSAGKYTIRVTNTDSTQPKISVREFYAVTVERDTTLNLTVKEATHYNMNLYVGNWGYDQVYVMDVDNDAIVDTLTGFISVGNLVATKSGQRLYVTTNAYSEYPYDITCPASVYSVDCVTKAKKKILERRAMICLEASGTPLIIASSTMRDTMLEVDTMRLVGTIDTVMDAVSFFDTLDICHSRLSDASESLVFDPNEPVFYTFTNHNQLFAYNYKDRKIVRYYGSIRDRYQMAISLDGKYIYCAGGPVLDVQSDSLVGWVGPGFGLTTNGSLALSPDGLYLYVTDPAYTWIPEPNPSGRIGVFQTSRKSYVGYIDVNIASGQAYTTTDAIVVTPDGRKAYVSDFWGGVFVVDLETNMVTSYTVISRRNTLTRFIALGAK